MPNDLTNISRDPKENHLATICYELNMLDFCHFKLCETDFKNSSSEKNVYIESFLLHYRNFIQFLAANGHKENSLSIKNPKVWLGREFKHEEITFLEQEGKKLLPKYWEKISRYLQHCTIDRSDNALSWNIQNMYAEINPSIQYFRNNFCHSPA